MKPKFCENCPITHLTNGYAPAKIKPTTTKWLVGDMPSTEDAIAGEPFTNSGSSAWLHNLCKAAKTPVEDYNLVQTIGCAPKNNIHPLQSEWIATSKSVAQEAVAYCRKHHLEPALAQTPNISEIVTLGEIPTQILTRRSPITTWRGSVLPIFDMPQKGLVVKPTLEPLAVAKQPHMGSVVVRDLKRSTLLPPENYNLAPTLDDVKKFDATSFSFDFEWDMLGNITICGLSDRLYSAIVVPFEGAYIAELQRIFENAKELIGHNIVGADLTHIAKLRWKLREDIVLWDTMLMQHLTQPDHRHGLAFVASVMTPKNFWKGSDKEDEDNTGVNDINGAQWKTWDKEGALPREWGGYGGCTSAKEAYALYNARDTDGTLIAYYALKNDLRRYDLEHVYFNVSIPASRICREMSNRGLKIDHGRLKELQATIDEQIAEAEKLLPPEIAPREVPITINTPAPPDTYKPKTRKYKNKTYTFTHPDQVLVADDGKELTPGKMTLAKIVKTPSTKLIRPYNSDKIVMDMVLGAGGKTILHSASKRPTAGKSAKQIWQRQFADINPEMAKTLGVLNELKRLNTARQSFAKEGFLWTNRVYYNILSHGTAEGRFSSSGQRKGLDPNIQNQPKEIRKLFVPDNAECCFLSVDISQGENELTALLSKDEARMKALRTPDYDEHSETATIALGVEVSKIINKHLRQVGKKINHMTNYGAKERKVQEALALEGFPYTVKAVKEMLERLALGRPALTAWQNEVIRFVEANKFAVNPFGRKRWFQDSRFGPKAIAFGPASTLADCVIRMMIACHASEYAKEISALGIKVAGDLPEGWDLRINVHDELCFHGPIKTLPDAAKLVQGVMTQPWEELGGFSFNIDIQASKLSWGDVKKYKIGEDLNW